MAVGLSDQVMFGPEGVGPGNQAQADVVRNIANLGIGALALGAGARGLSGLNSFLNRNLGGPTRTPMRQSFVRIPVPVEVKTKAEQEAMLAANEEGLDKEAGLTKLAGWAETTANTLGLLRQPGEKVGPVKDWIGGWGKPHAWNMPWAWPATAAAVGGGLYGGWKLTDYLLDKTKNMEQESELEQARQDYEKALAGRRKVASAEVRPLDALADLYEKQAVDWVNPLIGAGLLGTGLIGLGSGIGTYNWTRSLSQDKAVEEAVKRRQAQIAEQSPSPIMAIPTPVPVFRSRKSHWHQLLGQSSDGRDEKKANVGQAADQFLNRIKSNQMAVWQRLMTPTDGKAAKPAKPAEPLPPQLPTLAGTRTQLASR